MPRLIDLNPQWINHQDRKGLGILFDCMSGNHCGPDHNKPCQVRSLVLFANPLDGGAPWYGDSSVLIDEIFPENEGFWIAGCGTARWMRSGETLDTLSMSPSVNAGRCGHYTLTDGVFQ
jgi:hypothetical protein